MAAANSEPEEQCPPAAPGSCLLTLAFKDAEPAAAAGAAPAGQPPPKTQTQQPLQVDRALLWHASPVLRGAIEATCCGGGTAATTLTLVGDDPELWAAVLQLLQHTAPAVTWVRSGSGRSNVEALMELADKYDMAPLRTACASYMAAKVGVLDLRYPLDSPNNTLHAASLVERYSGYGSCGSGAGRGTSSGGSQQSTSDLEPYVDTISAAVDTALRPLTDLSGHDAHRRPLASDADAKAAASHVVSCLARLTQHSEYRKWVSEGVQGPSDGGSADGPQCDAGVADDGAGDARDA
ncbi:hypothetical protein HXX76_004325 [Chlamydomonas incerta]|uniref:BTB domain-containing protein n=1 Tax=Chlamydomonas incerta TaxID=51695 RepID=A0A835T7M6_CHLIN|nr:hypothetical protein HXX76_004325 [Chlamydomonas incerta]|eukprot:KAG2440213.1 hypothetical protein HXX76_004325 [Chlamydomonas incerta]